MENHDSDDASVISMSRFMNANRFSAVHEVEAYWDAIRAGRLVPRRSDIDPRGIERALEYAFILERVAPGIARLRIAGSHLSDLMGMEVRGMPLSAFVTPIARNDLGEVLEQVFDGPSKAVVDLYSERAIGKPAIEAKLLLLPMKSDLGDISRALGCFATHGDIGRTPRRFDVTGSHVTPLLGDFLVPDNGPRTTISPRATPRKPVEPTPRATGMDEATKPFAAKPFATTPFSTAPFSTTPFSTGPDAPQADSGARLRPGPRPYLRVVDTD